MEGLITITIVISMIIIIGLTYISEANINTIGGRGGRGREREKLIGYECGFQGEEEEIRKKWNVKYYIIAILFLIFDTEVMLVYPYISIKENNNIGYEIIIIIISILLIGLIYEINKGIFEKKEDV